VTEGRVGVRADAVTGVAESGNTAVLVTLDAAGAALDRREIALTRGLPTHPYHHEGAWAVGRYLDSPWARPITLEAAVALVRRVRAAAEEGAREALDQLAREVPVPIAALALRSCPPLPEDIEACIRDNRAQVQADSAMYRQALASAARERGWTMAWYERDTVQAAACSPSELDAALRQLGRAFGSPWRAQHKLAAMAAMAALRQR
jgi:hypothetical protein